MAWTAEADFNDLSVADLTGQSGGSGWTGAWSGSTNFDVQASVAYEGANAVSNAGGSNIARTLTTSRVTGIVYIAMRKSSNSSGGKKSRLRQSGGGIRVQINMLSSGNIVADASGSVTLVSGYSANTWYVFRITFDTGAGTYTTATSTDAFGTAGTFSAESATSTMGSTGNISDVMFDSDTGDTGYWDYISDTTPFTTPSGPATLKTWNTVTAANVKTGDTVAIASIKTIDTAA